MGDYDKIIKENIQAIFMRLLDKFIDLDIARTEEIKDKIQRTFEREPDFLVKVIDTAGKEVIIQMEFQTSDDLRMVYRMAEYKAVIQAKYELPLMQILFYLGNDQPKMRTQLTKEEQITGFELRDIRELNTAEVINSDIPEEIMLSILSGFPDDESEKVIATIIENLKTHTKSTSELNRHLQQLTTLSRLRKLETETKNKIKDMPITYDITTDGLYLEGKEEGRLEGKEEGRLEGKEEGRLEGKEEGREEVTIQMISNALVKGKLTVEEIAEMAEVTVDYVIDIQKHLQDAKQ